MSNLTTHRRTGFSYVLLDRNENEKRILDGVVPGGSVHVSLHTRLRMSGNFTFEREAYTDDIDWLNDRLRIDYTANGVTWPIGIFIFSVPTRNYYDGWTSRKVDLLGKIAAVDQDCVDSTYTVPVGAVITDEIVKILRSAGETKIAITPSSWQRVRASTWDAGTSKMTIVNDLLDSIDYWSILASGDGVLSAGPYQAPHERPVLWHLEEGRNAIHLPEFEREHDVTAIPNKMILVAQGGDADKPLVSVATNMNPDSPYSYPSRGRWIVKVDSEVDTDSQEVLDRAAVRRLEDATNPQAKLTVKHMPMPMGLTDVVEFRSQGVEVMTSIYSMRYSLTPTGLCETTLREFVSL